MTSDLDVFRTAALLLKEHGPVESVLVAGKRADELLDQGDEVGGWVWIRIVRAIGVLKSQAPREGEAAELSRCPR